MIKTDFVNEQNDKVQTVVVKGGWNMETGSMMRNIYSLSNDLYEDQLTHLQHLDKNWEKILTELHCHLKRVKHFGIQILTCHQESH
jgi:hypothetical protein